MDPTRRPESPTVRRAGADDRADLEHTFGAAFLDDPVWLHLLGRHRATVVRAGRALGALSMAHIADDCSTITTDGAAAAIWAPPKRYRITPRQFLPYLPAAVRGLGPGGMARLISMSDVEKLHPREPHYYLAVLGTHPDHQGRGLGSAVLAPTMAKADEDGVACYLESSKESNVAFYARHGFEVTGTHDIAEGKGPRLWLMWREPRVPGA